MPELVGDDEIAKAISSRLIVKQHTRRKTSFMISKNTNWRAPSGATCNFNKS